MNPSVYLAILCSAGLFGLSACRNPDAEAKVSDNAAKTPSQVLKNFEMNDVTNGIKTMRLVSIEGRIYETENVADVDQPLIYFYKQGKESSRLKAPMGRVKMDTHDVDAWGGVTVVSSDSSTLTTERLRYDPKAQKIYSDDPVHLEKTDSITDGIGLVTDPGLKTVKIGHQKVRFKRGI